MDEPDWTDWGVTLRRLTQQSHKWLDWTEFPTQLVAAHSLQTRSEGRFSTANESVAEDVRTVLYISAIVLRRYHQRDVTSGIRLDLIRLRLLQIGEYWSTIYYCDWSVAEGVWTTEDVMSFPTVRVTSAGLYSKTIGFTWARLDWLRSLCRLNCQPGNQVTWLRLIYHAVSGRLTMHLITTRSKCKCTGNESVAEHVWAAVANSTPAILPVGFDSTRLTQLWLDYSTWRSCRVWLLTASVLRNDNGFSK